MITIGLTGSIGMGKSTTSKLFEDEGVAVCDSDAVVHQLYLDEAVQPIEKAFPGVVENGEVNRKILGDLLRENPANFKVLEEIVHPLVRKRQAAFLQASREAGFDFALLDIPLLFETGAENRIDVVVVVTCAPEIQKQRVMDRPGMTEEKLQMILARQMPDEEKRKRADYIIDTSSGIADARLQVKAILDKLKSDRGSET